MPFSGSLPFSGSMPASAAPDDAAAESEADARREAAREALWDWSYIAGAFVSMAATLWLAASVWATA